MRVWLGIEDEDPTSKVVANEKAMTVTCHVSWVAYRIYIIHLL
jgi:hypothetical protein